jgi:hypothetical protein
MPDLTKQMGASVMTTPQQKYFRPSKVTPVQSSLSNPVVWVVIAPILCGIGLSRDLI